MNSALASVGKNFILLSILILSVVNLYTYSLNWRELFAIQCLVGIAYIFLSSYEYLNVSYKASLPVQRYRYFTNSFLMFRALKIGVFVSFTVLLFVAESKIRYIYPVCAIIASTEAIVLYLKYKNSLCFVNIYANYLLIVQTHFVKLFASEILIVEFRHAIFYFVKKDQKSIQIKLEHIEAKDSFVQSMNDWIIRNNVLVSAESKVKIKELIS
jgi:hypothetical protein